MFNALGPFAERNAIPVVQFWRTRTAIATDHPMFAGEAPRELLPESDVVVVLDSLVPWIPATASLRDDATVFTIGPDPAFSRTPMHSFPSEVALTSVVSVALDELAARLDDCLLYTSPSPRDGLLSRMPSSA